MKSSFILLGVFFIWVTTPSELYRSVIVVTDEAHRNRDLLRLHLEGWRNPSVSVTPGGNVFIVCEGDHPPPPRRRAAE